MDNLHSSSPVNPVGPVLNGTVSQGECESCPNKDVRITKSGSIWMCDECVQKDIDAAMKHQTPELQEARLKEHKLLEQIRIENAALKINTDIFNAKIRAIHELKEELDKDERVENKNYTLAQVIAERFSHLNGLIHDIDAQKIEYQSEQRAIQTYYNNMSSQLRAEEREKIKLQDASYQPIERVVKVKKEAPKKNWDKSGVLYWAQKSGFSEQMIQIICLTRNLAPEAAVKILEESKVPKEKK